MNLRSNLFRFMIPAAAALAVLLTAGAQKAPKSPVSAPAKTTTDPTTEALRRNNLGVAYMNQQRFEQALKQFEEACALDSTLVVARLNQGIALYNLQRMDAARAVLEEVVQKDPSNARAWFNLGLLHRNRGEAEEAMEAFARVARLDPDDADTQYYLGAVAMLLEKYEAAVPAFERALELNPFHVSAEFGLARAYQRSGQAERAREHLARFQRISQEKLGAPISLSYGDQGRYSLAEEAAGAVEDAAAPIPVRFASVARLAGLRFRHVAQTGEASTDSDAELTLAQLGSGACFLDADGDGRQDLVLLSSDTKRALRLFRNLGRGRFVEGTSRAGLAASGYALGCTAGDYDNDGHTDLAVSFAGSVHLYRNMGKGKFADVSAAAGLAGAGAPLGLTFVDYDHDGDLDLYVAHGEAESGNILWRNNGNGTFANVTQATGLAGTGRSVGAALTDFNNDRAVDLVVTGEEEPAVFANPREGQFTMKRPWEGPAPKATAGVVVFDFNKDGWMDLAFTHWGKPGLSLWRNVAGKKFERVALPEIGWTRGWGLAAIDYDNDGWIDLAVAGEGEHRGEMRLLRNLGSKGFEDVSRVVGLSALKLQDPRALLAADYDADGDADLLVTQNSGPVVLLRNDGGNRNAWLRLALKGLNDNKSGFGTKVEIFAGRLRQKWEAQAASGYLGQGAAEILVGLGSERAADIVRLVWPTGVLQDEIQVAARQKSTMEEIDRRGSSCPVLFAWNGERYEFVTDMVGAGVLGHWVAPGVSNTPDPTEFVRVQGAQVRERDGLLSFRFAEPMEETVYLDHVRLLAVDHPAEFEVYPNEQFRVAPPFPEFRVIASRDAQPPAGAWDERGRDVLLAILSQDRKYADGFAKINFKGFAEMHSLELDLGEAYEAGPLRLILSGFIDYFTPTSAYAAHQAGVVAVVPYVEAQDASGRWVKVIEEMGFPAGLHRTMVADLSGRLPAGTRRIRITTNLMIYWDQVRIDTTAESPQVRLTDVPLARAELQRLGFPKLVEGNLKSDVRFQYDEVSQNGPYARHAGNFTRYGDVMALLVAPEDRYAVLASGDEVALEFDPSVLLPLPPGWTRDYFFYADGFTKDMDFYAAHAFTVDPLPFHGMGGYPYPASRTYPQDPAALDYLLNYNTRQDRGSIPARLLFEYRRQKPLPSSASDSK